MVNIKGGYKMKHKVVVINIFEGDNLLILYSKGNRTVIGFHNPIKKEDVYQYLKVREIDIDDCEIHIVKENWKGQTVLEEV